MKDNVRKTIQDIVMKYSHSQMTKSEWREHFEKDLIKISTDIFVHGYRMGIEHAQALVCDCDCEHCGDLHDYEKTENEIINNFFYTKLL